MDFTMNFTMKAPYTYLCPSIEQDTVTFYIFDAQDRQNPSSNLYTPSELDTYLSRVDPQHDLLSGAGSFAQKPLNVLAEALDPERYENDNDYLAENVVNAVLAIPALTEFLRSFGSALMEWSASYQGDPVSLNDPIWQPFMERQAAFARCFTLPALPIEIRVDGEGDEWTFSVLQRFDQVNAEIFRSAENFIEQDELLMGFLLYRRFACILPRLSVRLRSETDGPDILAILFNAFHAFSNAQIEFDALRSSVEPKQYNHAFDLAFEVQSNAPEGSDVTATMLRQSLTKRLRMSDSELVEACGAPFDSHEE